MRRVKDGFVFQLYAPNRLILSTSPVYITEDACKKGILTVMEQGKNAGEADLTEVGTPLPKAPRYEIMRDAAGSFRFRLRANKGDVILTSSAYSDPTLAALGIGMVRENVEDARTYVWRNGEVALMNLLRREKKSEKKPPKEVAFELMSKGLGKTHAVRVKMFAANDSCIGCGTCVRICPRGNIRLIDKKPSFGTDCIGCLSCVQYCPAWAINIGKITEKRERFPNPNVQASELMEKIIHID